MTGRVGVVLPIHDAASFLPGWLEAVIPQCTAAGIAAVAVDDASNDASVRLAEDAGVRVLRLPARRGPYVARNLGWRSLDTGIVIFLDVRSRPRSGALDALVRALDDERVAVVGGEIVTRAGCGAAARWAALDQPLSLRWHLADPFLPFVPTAALAIRREHLEALGGFADVRSAGDADLCWRAQLAGLGSVESAPGAVFDAEPRRSAAEILSQAKRFGAAHVDLWAAYSGAGRTLPAPVPAARRLRAAAALARNSLAASRDLGVTWLRVRRQWIYESSYSRAYRERYRSGPSASAFGRGTEPTA